MSHGGSQQVVDDYVGALLGDVLGAVETDVAPTTAHATRGPDASLQSIAQAMRAPGSAVPDARSREDSAHASACATHEVPHDLASVTDYAQGSGPSDEAAPCGDANTKRRIDGGFDEAVERDISLVPHMAAPTAFPAAITPLPAREPARNVPAAVRTDSCTTALRTVSALPASQRWLRVVVGIDSYALELLSVQEVVRLAPIVAMRGARRAVLGVMNLRGRIVPVFDLGLWLGTAGVQPDERSRIVVVERHDELIGVLVSGVEDVVTLGRDRIEPPLPGSNPGTILGVARVGAAPTVLLDAGALFV